MTRTAFLAAVLMTCGSLLAQPATSTAQDDSPFDKGTWTLSLTGGYITPIRYSEDKFVNLNLGAGYYFHDNHQANLELEGYYSDEREEVPYDEFGPGDSQDVIIGGLGLLLRWHFLARERFSLFLDGGGSITDANVAFPSGGTHFNFTGKIGLGASLRLDERMHLIGGARYFHLSNGQIRKSDDNPGYDGIQIWAGLMWTR